MRNFVKLPTNRDNIHVSIQAIWFPSQYPIEGSIILSFLPQSHEVEDESVGGIDFGKILALKQRVEDSIPNVAKCKNLEQGSTGLLFPSLVIANVESHNSSQAITCKPTPWARVVVIFIPIKENANKISAYQFLQLEQSPLIQGQRQCSDHKSQ